MIRLKRVGSKNKPFYHVVVSESTRTTRARFSDQIGFYDPKRRPKVVQIDVDKAEAWIRKGAHPSETVARLIAQAREARVAQGG